jgi:hypothetical protein
VRLYVLHGTRIARASNAATLDPYLCVRLGGAPTGGGSGGLGGGSGGGSDGGGGGLFARLGGGGGGGGTAAPYACSTRDDACRDTSEPEVWPVRDNVALKDLVSKPLRVTAIPSRVLPRVRDRGDAARYVAALDRGVGRGRDHAAERHARRRDRGRWVRAIVVVVVGVVDERGAAACSTVVALSRGSREASVV